MYIIKIYRFTLIFCIYCIALSFSSVTESCEVPKANEQCHLCAKNCAYNNKNCRDIYEDSIKHECFENGYEFELIKPHTYFFQQRISIFPPKTGSCFFDVYFNNTFEDRLHISGKRTGDWQKGCSQNSEWISYKEHRKVSYTLELEHRKGTVYND